MQRLAVGLGIVLFGLFAWLTIALADTLTVTASRANVRQGPGITHAVIDTLTRGATFPVLETKNGWHQIRLDDGRTAWIAASIVRLHGPAAGVPDSPGRGMESQDLASSQRVALVIGNGTYDHVPALHNPPNDAAAISVALERLGFAVIRLDDAGKSDLEDGLLTFLRAAQGSEIAIAYFAGHGLEVDKRNFLVPVDARLENEWSVELETVSLDIVMGAVGRASQLGLVILDACRNNPFLASMQRSGATRAIGRGLARVEPAGETLVAYAAKEGTMASDGDGRHSPYTDALLRYLEEPGLEVGLMFRKVRDAVLASTKGVQEPFLYGSLSSKGIYLTAQTPPPDPVTAVTQQAGPPTAPAQPDPEAKMWALIENSTDAADYVAYLTEYGSRGRFAPLARFRLEQLRRESPPVSPAGDAQETQPQPTSIGNMLAVCAAHLKANRLTSGAGGTAFECYQEVLRRDASNMQAIDGLAKIAERYRRWAEDAVEGSNWQRAQRYLQKLQQVHPEHPAIAALETRLEAPMREREQARLQEERRRQETERQLAEQRQLEEARKQEQARLQEERRRQETERQLEQQRQLEEARKQEQARLQEERRRQETERQLEQQRQLEETRKREQARLQEERRRQETERQLAEQRQREEARRREQARLQEERRRQETERQLAEQRQREEARKREQARREQESRKRRLSDLLSMVRVQGGNFKMGCEAQQIDTTRIDERPIRRVHLSSFEISKYEVTQELWETVMGVNPSRFRGCSRCPVENVSWHDVQGFITKLNGLTGEHYRLPTEAEWEYAARGGQRGRRHIYSGGNILGSVAWHSGNSGKRTHPVGRKRPNELGLFDMSGNVNEWVQDWYQRRISGPLIDPQGPASGSLRLSRGGSWNYVGGFCRSTSRAAEDPRNSSDRLGFRLARSSS